MPGSVPGIFSAALRSLDFCHDPIGHVSMRRASQSWVRRQMIGEGSSGGLSLTPGPPVFSEMMSRRPSLERSMRRRSNEDRERSEHKANKYDRYDV
jgi:hypothetical protein